VSATSVGAISVEMTADPKPAAAAFDKVNEKLDAFATRTSRAADAAAKVVSRVDELRTKQEQLTKAISAAERATDRDEETLAALRAELERTRGATERLTGAQQVNSEQAGVVHRRFDALRTSADRLDDRMGKLQTATGGISSAFGAAGGPIGDMIGAVSDLAMTFAAGGPLMAGLAVVGGGLALLGKAWADSAEAAKAAAKESLTALTSMVDQVTKANASLDQQHKENQINAFVAGLDMQQEAVVRGFLEIGDAMDALRKFESDFGLAAANPFSLIAGNQPMTRDPQRAPKVIVAGSIGDPSFAVFADKTEQLYGLLQDAVRKTAQTASSGVEAAGDPQELERAEEIRAANDQASRDLVYAIGFDAATMAAVGQNTAAFILAAQNNGKIGSEFPDPGESAFELPAEGLKLELDSQMAMPALGRLQLDSLEPALDGVIAPFKAVAPAFEGLGDKLEAGQQGLVNFGQRLGESTASTTAFGEALLSVDGVLNSMLAKAGRSPGDAARFVGSSIGGAALGGIFGQVAGAVVDGVEQAMGVAVEALASIVGDERFATALDAVDGRMLVIGILLSGFTFGISGVVAFGVAATQVASSLATQTESFERFQGAMSVVVDRVILAFEPLFQGMLWLVGVFDVVADVMMPFIDSFASSDMGELLFRVVQPMLWAFAGAAWAAGMIGNAFLTAGSFLVGLIPGQGEFAESLRRLRVDTDALGEAWTAAGELTYEQAQANGEAAAATWDLAEASRDAARSMTNIPSWYRVPLAEYRAAGRQSALREAAGISIYGPININGGSSLQDALRQEMRRRGVPFPPRRDDEAN
jgi:hypothetical protein